MSRNFLNIVVISLALVVLGSLIFLVIPTHLNLGSINSLLGSVSNIVVYLSTLYTAAAFVVALIAYRVAIKRPRLRVKIMPWRGELGKLTLVVTPSHRVDITLPHTSWQVWLENTGQASARFPIVQIEFNGLYFGDEAFKGWEKVLHAHSRGWYGIRWSPGADVVVHPNFPLELPRLYFSGLALDSVFHEPSLEVTVTVAADGFEPLRVKRSVEIIHSEVDYDWDTILAIRTKEATK